MQIDEQTLKNLYSHGRGLEVLVDKTIVFLGDSVMRGMYKDMVKYIKCGDMLKEQESKRKGELSFHEDILVYGGDKLAKKTNGKEFREYRVIKLDNGIIIKYHYICRAYNDHVESILEHFMQDPPDIVVVNSCLWDLHRYDKRCAMEKFKENVLKLAKKLSALRVPIGLDETKEPLLIWTTTPPCECDVPIIEDFTEVSDDPNAYNFTAQIDELNSANIWLGQMLPRYTFNVVDLGTVMAKAIHNREKDGVHWNAVANRMYTMLILSRVELHLAKPGEQKIPTVIYSPLLYVTPPPNPPPSRAILPTPAPAPPPSSYPEHQFYDGMNEFNDRYSFNQASANNSGRYYHDSYDNNEDYGGSGGQHGPDYTADYTGPPGPCYGASRGRGYPPGRGRGGHHAPYPLEERYSNPYNDYNNEYNNYYNDQPGPNNEQWNMRNQQQAPMSRSRELLAERRVQLAARERPPARQVAPQHRAPPARHVPPPRQTRRHRPY
ncbi:hypothetical protein ACHWQZ_G003773 [Mnemiopsis leidyi]